MSESKTAAEAGWRYSRYNLFARVPDTDTVVLVNTLYGRCQEYSLKEYALIKKVLSFPEAHPLVTHYRNRGIITDRDETEILKEFYSENHGHPDTVILTICPTMACNFDCPYCFEKHIPGRMPDAVQDEVVSLAERMMEESGAKLLSVNWFGGEPLLGIDIIESLSDRLISLAHAHGADYTAEIITNGYLLDAHAVSVLEKGKVWKIQITLDGRKEVHDKTRHLVSGGGTFDGIVNNLRQKLPFHILIRHNLTEANREEEKPLEQFIHDLREETGNDLTYYPAAVFESEAAAERGEEIRLLCDEEGEELSFDNAALEFETREPALCDACKAFAVTIDHEGKLYPCCQKAGDPREFYGLAKEYDPHRPIETSRRPEITAFYKNTEFLFEGECGGCVFLPQCSGACPAERRKGHLNCPYYKDQPEEYALGIYRYLKKKHNEGKH